MGAKMSVYDYDFKIEGLMAQCGGEVDKDITRTCGNCCFYDNEIFVCNKSSEDIEGQETIEATTLGCWNHMTKAEQERLKAIVEEDNRQAARRRVAENRQNGTGDCAGCPFRKVAIDALLGGKELKETLAFIAAAQEMRDMLDEDMKFLRDTAEWLVNHRGMKGTLLVATMFHRAEEIEKLLSKAKGEE